MIEFVAYPKTPRFFRDIIITEKIDGTNAAVGVLKDGTVYAQSRTKIITPKDDNFGFARWVAENSPSLASYLGPGLHFGEWWGSGIQRGYGLMKGERRFSLFNATRWGGGLSSTPLCPETVPGLYVVPTLSIGRPASDRAIEDALCRLRCGGSKAAPGYMRPEGIIIYHTAARQVFKVLLENDALPKGAL